MKILFLIFCIIGHLFGNENQSEYRIYQDPSVCAFYHKHNQNQTLEFVLQKKQEYNSLNHLEMGIWEAIEQLDQLIDASDPDLGLPQIYHCFQTAEALRKDGHPRWLILVGLIHDLGKMLQLYGEPDWAVVGDTFPVGCRFSDKNVGFEYFQDNPDWDHPIYNELLGIYHPHCGLDKVHMAWGHDEYLYQVVKDYMPPEAAYIIRYHSFYPLHKEGAYESLMSDLDQEMLPYLKLFSRYDLYSKSEEILDLEKLKPFYQELVSQFFPEKIRW